MIEYDYSFINWPLGFFFFDKELAFRFENDPFIVLCITNPLALKVKITCLLYRGMRMTATWFHLLISYQVLVWFGPNIHVTVINEISQSNICINYFLIIIKCI